MNLKITPDLRTDKGKGFHMTFDNGYTISVQWGEGNYCSSPKSSSGNFEANTAEVAAWDENGKWLKLGDGDDVIGWQTPNEIAELITKISKL